MCRRSLHFKKFGKSLWAVVLLEDDAESVSVEELEVEHLISFDNILSIFWERPTGKKKGHIWDKKRTK